MIDPVDLGNDLESFIAEMVSTDRFRSVEAVLRESVRLLEIQERNRAKIDARIALGLADSAAGRVKPLDEVFDRVEARIRATHGLR